MTIADREVRRPQDKELGTRIKELKTVDRWQKIGNRGPRIADRR